MHQRVSIAWGIFSVAFVLLVTVSASRLTFFWDDYDALLTQADDPLGSLVKGAGGHWPPLSRAALVAQTHLFGFWYPGYVLCSAILLVASWWLFARALSDMRSRTSWLWVIGGIVYVTSVGVLINIFVATTQPFILSTALAGGAALALTSRRHWLLWTGLLAACFLSMSGMFVINASIVAAVYVVHSRLHGTSPGTGAAGTGAAGISSAVLRRAALIFAAGVLLTGVGYVLATVNPTDYYALTSDGAGGARRTMSIVDMASGTVYFVVGWIIAPLLPTAVLSTTFVTTLIVNFAQRPALFALVLVAGLAALVLLIWWTHRGRRREVWVSLIPGVLLVPLVIWAGLLHVQRQIGLFTLRYALMWLLIVLLFWIVVAGTPSASRLSKVIRVAVVGLLSISAVFGLVRLPASIDLASNADKDRLQFSAPQIEQAINCRAGRPVESVEEVAPTVSDTDFCRLVDYLVSESISGRVFNYP